MGVTAAQQPYTKSDQAPALHHHSHTVPASSPQGPPGTGKTRTILNLLSVVMHAAAKGSLELLQAGAMGSSREVGGRELAGCGLMCISCWRR
jgi:hypothetical protein